jgi:hypothetical protein
MAVITRFIGCLFISFSIVAWITDMGKKPMEASERFSWVGFFRLTITIPDGCHARH